MKLDRIFQDYMILQRGMETCIRGTAEREETVSVRWNGAELFQAALKPGRFSLFLPPMEAQTDAVLSVGDMTVSHVDVGEVWVAGGQSNMEFLMKYDAEAARELPQCRDGHIRMYTVGQYGFPEERELGYKDWQGFDRWLPLEPRAAERMSAIGVYFARLVRETWDVPVGIISCNWGGTKAGSWISRERLETIPALRVCLEDYENGLSGFDAARYAEAMKVVRPAMASPMTALYTDAMMGNTFHPREAMQRIMSSIMTAAKDRLGAAGMEPASAPASPPREVMELLRFVGPGDKNVPGALYGTMLREILGYSCRGVLWYQGEQDEARAAEYDAMLTQLIRCWREDWRAVNPHMERLPFLSVQLAPFGTWQGGNGKNYPVLREAQRRVADSEPDVYLASVSDVGSVFDIHPKDKRTPARRLFLLAEKYIYGKPDVKADAPDLARMEAEDGRLTLVFRNAEALSVVPSGFTSYNGFPVSDIPQELLPPVLGGVNGLEVWVGGARLQQAEVRAEGNRLLVLSDEIVAGAPVKVLFAQTGFYEVNLYSEAGLPAFPFTVRTTM